MPSVLTARTTSASQGMPLRGVSGSGDLAHVPFGPGGVGAVQQRPGPRRKSPAISQQRREAHPPPDLVAAEDPRHDHGVEGRGLDAAQHEATRVAGAVVHRFDDRGQGERVLGRERRSGEGRIHRLDRPVDRSVVGKKRPGHSQLPEMPGVSVPRHPPVAGPDVRQRGDPIARVGGRAHPQIVGKPRRRSLGIGGRVPGERRDTAGEGHRQAAGGLRQRIGNQVPVQVEGRERVPLEPTPRDQQIEVAVVVAVTQGDRAAGEAEDAGGNGPEHPVVVPVQEGRGVLEAFFRRAPGPDRRRCHNRPRRRWRRSIRSARRRAK